MKPLSLLLLIILATGYSSCDLFNSEDEPKTELEKLPPITHTGENTFGYLLNGKAIVVTNTMKITAIYQQGLLQLGGGVENNNIDIDITIVLEDPLETGISYNLTNFPIHRSRYRDYKTLNICDYTYEDTFKGSLIFSKIDRTNFIISGTFEFSTVTQGCDTVRITDGRFDVQYIP